VRVHRVLLGQWAGHVLPNVNDELSHMARWLMAWSDGVTTGMLTAVFVVFRPHWVATWSDAIYTCSRLAILKAEAVEAR
jgi:uncharacterized membrane protein